MSTDVTKDQLLAVLQQHIGRDRGIGAQAIAEALHCNKRHVRHLVTELREGGTAVCGTPREGYYIAATAAELKETCAFLRSRAMHSLVLESRLTGLALEDLIGQLRLPT